MRAALVIVLLLESAQPASGVRSEVVSFAQNLKFYGAADAVYDRNDFRDRCDPNGTYTKTLKSFHARVPAWSSVELAALLRDDDPRVRLLAIAALARRGDAQILPRIAALQRDDAAAFGRIDWDKHCGMFLGVEPWTAKTPGELATQVVALYVSQSGAANFDEFWRTHRAVDRSAGLFAVQLARASGGTTPTQNDRRPAIVEVRKRIDKLPKEERAWTLLWLSNRAGADALASEDDLMRAAMSIAPGRLESALEGRIESTDVVLRGSRLPGHARAIVAVALWRQRSPLRSVVDAWFDASDDDRKFMLRAISAHHAEADANTLLGMMAADLRFKSLSGPMKNVYDEILVASFTW